MVDVPFVWYYTGIMKKASRVNDKKTERISFAAAPDLARWVKKKPEYSVWIRKVVENALNICPTCGRRNAK